MLNRIPFSVSLVLIMAIITIAWAEDGIILVKVAPVLPNLSASVQFTEPSDNNR